MMTLLNASYTFPKVIKVGMVNRGLLWGLVEMYCFLDVLRSFLRFAQQGTAAPQAELQRSVIGMPLQGFRSNFLGVLGFAHLF